jgi:hypothetical protein
MSARKSKKKPKCPVCKHVREKHGPPDAPGCWAQYSAGPSGTFRCPCGRGF